jgi:hypothetical protein
MRYERFEELPVWQASVELALATYAMTAQPAFRQQRSLRDQIERATLSFRTTSQKDSKGVRIRNCSLSCTLLAVLREKHARCCASSSACPPFVIWNPKS